VFQQQIERPLLLLGKVVALTQIKEPIPLLEEQPVLLQQLELEIVVAQEVRLNAIQYKLLEGI
jgi:hypothetical protein|tara:strand:- start:204 stop:392 length:189 start_codon:yes stop_codon:yes gene_type:complete